MPDGLAAGAARYPNVFRPLRIAGVELRNRIFVPAHTTNFGEDNLPSDRHLAYHRARAARRRGADRLRGDPRAPLLARPAAGRERLRARRDPALREDRAARCRRKARGCSAR